MSGIRDDIDGLPRLVGVAPGVWAEDCRSEDRTATVTSEIRVGNYGIFGNTEQATTTAGEVP